MRPSSPLLDSVRDLFEGQDQMAKDFAKAFGLPMEQIKVKQWLINGTSI